MALNIAPITEVFTIIDSCTNDAQLETCKKLALYYTRMAKEKGVINPEVIKETLDLKIEEKRTELEYIEAYA